MKITTYGKAPRLDMEPYILGFTDNWENLHFVHIANQKMPENLNGPIKVDSTKENSMIGYDFVQVVIGYSIIKGKNMNLKDLLLAVKDEHLSLSLCEKYRDSLIHYKTAVSIEIADKRKARALFMLAEPQNGSVAQRKLEFDGIPEGQRLIELEGYYRALGGEISSLQSRIYAHLRLQG